MFELTNCYERHTMQHGSFFTATFYGGIHGQSASIFLPVHGHLNALVSFCPLAPDHRSQDRRFGICAASYVYSARYRCSKIRDDASAPK